MNDHIRGRDLAFAELQAALLIRHDRYLRNGIARCPNCSLALTVEPTPAAGESGESP